MSITVKGAENKKTVQNVLLFLNLVPGTGIEPVRYYYRKILSLVRLPIPPPGHWIGHSLEIRTPDPLIKSQVLYRLS